MEDIQESNSENIIKCCIGLMEKENPLLLIYLFENFNRATFDKGIFDEWINEFI